MKRFFGIGLAVLAVAASCAKRETPVSVGNREQILYRGNTAEPESLDPYLVRGAMEWTIVGGLFEGLVTPDLTTLEPRPGVAERWDVSADGLTYTFKIRPGTKWQNLPPLNGRAFTAQDAMFALDMPADVEVVTLKLRSGE